MSNKSLKCHRKYMRKGNKTCFGHDNHLIGDVCKKCFTFYKYATTGKCVQCHRLYMRTIIDNRKQLNKHQHYSYPDNQKTEMRRAIEERQAAKQDLYG